MTTFVQSINPFAQAERDYFNNKKASDVVIQVGSANRVVDTIRNVLSLESKLLLWNRKMSSGNVSPETLEKVREYLHVNGLHDVLVSVNQYNPSQVWSRTFSNPKTSLLSKMTVGLASCLVETISIPKLTGYPGDCYVPTSNTVHLFSDDLAIALHECGHAKDFNSRENPVLYNLSSRIPLVGPLVGLYHEAVATHHAINHLKWTEAGNEPVKHAYRVLLPAFTTYVHSVLLEYLGNSVDYQKFLDPDTLTQEDVRNGRIYLVSLAAMMVSGHAVARFVANRMDTKDRQATEA